RRPSSPVGRSSRGAGARNERRSLSPPQGEEVMLVEWPRRVGALAQFHVDDLEAPELQREDEQHLRKVLRAREGEEVVVTDGQGSWALYEVLSFGLRR